MKKLVVMMVLVLGTVAFGRDFDYRGKTDVEQSMEVVLLNQEMVARERQISDNNMVRYEEFHQELMTMDRGESDR